MEQNKDIIIPEIKIPELPEDPKPKKRRSKLPIIIILSVVVALIIAVSIPAYILLDPIMQTTHWENTINEVFFDQNELSAFTSALSEGARTDISIELEKSLTGLLRDISLELSVADRLSDNKESGNMTFSLTGGAKTLALSLVYDESNAAIGIYEYTGGVIRGDIEYLSLPRHGLTDAFKTSIFAPDSGTKYALDEEIFDQIITSLEAFERADESNDVEALETSLQNVSNKIIGIIAPQTSIYFADDAFELCRKISITIDDDELGAIMDILADEADASEAFAAFMESSYSMMLEEGGTEQDFASALREAKKDIPDCEMSFSYVVRGDYVRNLSCSYKDLADNANSFDADLEFIYGETSKGFDLIITFDGDDQGKVSYRKEFSDSESILSITIEADGESVEAKGIHNTADDSLIITAKSDADPEDSFELRGSCKYDEVTAELSLSISSLKIGTADAIEGFEFEMYLGKYTEDIVIPESHPLLTMGAEELDKYIEGLPSDAFGDIVKSCTGKELESYFSADGQLMLNAEQYTELATSYANAYSNYLSKAEIMRADAVYIPVPELGINILLYYDAKSNYIYYNYAYNMTDVLLDAYHIAYFDESGNLCAHDIILEADREPTCLEAGLTAYSCSICSKTLTIKKDILFHTYAQKTLDLTADNGKKYSANYWYCSVCGFVSNFEIVGQMGVSFIYDHKNNTYTIESYTLGGGTIENYYGIPSVFDEVLTITDVKLANLENCISVRIPYGVKTLMSGRFYNSDDVQVLILPSTIKEIKSGALPSYQRLHTIFFCGTEAEWKNVELGDLKNIIDDINVIFCPNGVNAADIQKVIIDTEKIESAINDAKGKVTQSIKAAQEVSKNEKVTLFHKEQVENVIYDEVGAMIAVCGVFNGNETLMSVYDIKSGTLVASFKVPGDVTLFDIREGYVAYACAESTQVYVYNISTAETRSFKAPSYSDISWDSIAAVYIHRGKVYTSTVEQHCYLSYYDLATGEITKINQILYPDIYINRELDRIVNIKKTGSPKTVEFYDLKTNTFIKEIWLENRVHYITFKGDYLIDSQGALYDLNGDSITSYPEGTTQIEPARSADRIILETLYSEADGDMSLFIKKGYKLGVALTGANSDEAFVLDFYAESAIVTDSGDFLIYTPGGYGLLFINMN